MIAMYFRDNQYELTGATFAHSPFQSPMLAFGLATRRRSNTPTCRGVWPSDTTGRQSFEGLPLFFFQRHQIQGAKSPIMALGSVTCSSERNATLRSRSA